MHNRLLNHLITTENNTCCNLSLYAIFPYRFDGIKQFEPHQARIP